MEEEKKDNQHKQRVAKCADDHDHDDDEDDAILALLQRRFHQWFDPCLEGDRSAKVV